MTPEQRLSRVERLMGLFVREGTRLREESREQNQKINILIQSQMETTEQLNRFSEQMNRFSVIHDREMADLRRSQKLTDQSLRALINTMRRDKNGQS